MTTISDKPSLPSFSKRLEIGATYLNFYFNFCSTTEGSYFLVSVVDANGKTHLFKMKEQDGTWLWVNPEKCSDWIKNRTQHFSDIITQQLQPGKLSDE
jgi:hypothetical protein